MRDCYYEQNMGISDFDDEERDSGNNLLNEPRTGMSVDENFMKKLILSFMKSTRHTGSPAFKRRSGCSVTLFRYCARMKIISETKLPIYQNPQWPQGNVV